MTVARRAPGAAFRKPPKEETAGGGRGCGGLGYGDLGAADEVGEWSRCSSKPVDGESAAG